MAITEIQKAFCDIATQYSTDLLHAHFSPKQDESGKLDALETAGTVIETADAGILIAGVIAAPGTAGISLGTAAAIVVLAKAGKVFYEWSQTFSKNPDEGQYPPEVKKDVAQLRLRVQLHRTLYLFTLRYAHVIETIVDKKSLRRFAEQTVARLLKFQLSHEETMLGTVLPAEDLLDLLLSSAKINVIKKADSVSVQQSKAIYSKYLWALPVWYVYDEDGNGEFIGSQNEHAYLKPTTHIECGVIALPREKLQLNNLAVDLHGYKKLTAADLGRFSPPPLLQTLWIRHHVTCDEMRGYLASVRQPGAAVLSLNDYLSQLYKKTMIACCHDDRFKGFDLQGGYFSDVDFSEADLSDCDLRNTNWSGCYTWLTKTIFNRVRINQNSHFQDVHAEESVWTEVSFLDGVNLLRAKFNAAMLVRCTMTPASIMQPGTDWLLATFLDPIMVDKYGDLQKDLQNKLNTEQQERQQLQKKMNGLTNSLDEQTHLLATQIQTNTTNTTDTHRVWVAIREEIDALKAQSSRFPEWVSQLNLLHEQCERIEKAFFSKQSAITELEQFRQEEEMRWSEQSHANTVFDQRLSDIENTHSVSNRLIHYCREEVDTSNFQFIKTAYIELLCSAFLHSKEVPESLTESVDKFIATGEGFFLLHGDPGCGRTTFLKLLYIEFIEKLIKAKQANVVDRDPPVLVPVLIDMHEVQDSERNGLRVALETRLGIALVDKLIESEQSLIIVDNFDVGNIPLQKFIEDCVELGRQFKYQPKFIFSTKTSYLFSLGRDYHELFMAPHFGLDTERIIQNFNRSQTKQFFSRYHQDSIYERFLELQTRTPEIRLMLQSPLLLSIIVGAFHSSSFNADKMTLRGDFYAESWHALYEHVRHLLPEKYKDYENFIDLIQSIAVAIYKQGSDWFEHKRHLSPSARDRDPLSLLQMKVRYLSFLLITKKPDALHVRFLHPSLGHYWVAQKLLTDLYEDDYLSQNALALWNLRNLRESPDILSFLVELIQKAEADDGVDLQTRLMAIVMQTANPAQRHSVMASANAMTVRCRLNKHIDRLSLNNVQIPDFDGTGISGVGTLFRNALIRGAWLIDAMLLWADMDGSDATDVRFLNASSFIQTDGELKTFAIYPSLCEMLIAYVVKPESSFRNYQIALMRIKNGQPEKLISWPAHVRDIYTLAFAVSADEKTVLLASAGEGGTIRIWRFNQLNGSVEKILKLYPSKKTPIYALAWSPDANYLAAGHDDRHVRIWDLQTPRKIYKSKKFSTSAIRALIWSQQNRLFAIDDGNILHIWDNPQEPNPDLRLQCVVLQKLTPIRQMALTNDGQLLALTQFNGDVPVVSIEEDSTSRLYAVFRGHKRKVNKVCWADKLLISASDDETGRIWHDPRYHRILPHGHAVEHVALSTNEQEAIFGVSNAHTHSRSGASSRIYFWNVYPFQGEHLPQDTLGSVASITTHIMPDQTLHIVAGYINGSVMLYIQDGQKQITEKLLWEHQGVSISQVAWSADGRFIASLCQDGTMVVKDMNDEERPLLILQAESHEAINHFAWIKTENFTTFFITVDMSGAILVYDAASQSPLNVGHMKVSVAPPLLRMMDSSASSPFPAQCVAILNDQINTLVTTIAVSRGESVEIWSIDLSKTQEDTSSFVKACVFPHKNEGAVMLSWSPNGNYLASLDSQQTIYVWSDAYHCLYFYTHPSPIHCLVWSEHYLIAGTQNEMLIWDTTQPDIWSQLPTTIRIGSPLLNVVNQHLVVADNKAIWLCFRPDLFAGRGPASWVATIKQDLLLHGAKSPTHLSEINKALLRQKGADTSGYQKLNFFGSWTNNVPVKFPPPVKREELKQLSVSRQSSMQSLKKESSDSANESSPRIRASSSSPGVIF